MSDFKRIESSDPIKAIVKSAFEADLAISGGWGYDKASATVIHDTQEMPITQLQHTLTMMRAYIEMNMTLSEQERYGSINPNEVSREEVSEDGRKFHTVSYTVSAMKESTYADFINEYKKHYGEADFDMSDHFSRRKAATIVRTVTHWFDVSALKT